MIISESTMNETLKFSVIIPVYNAELFLPKCIESVLFQSYQNWELILINDGSTDNSSQICDSYVLKDNRIKVIHKQNQGVSAARNSGLDVAVGEYICFIDSDDVIDLHLFEIVLPFIDKQIDCIVYGYDRIHNGQLEEFLLPNGHSNTDLDLCIWELKYHNLFVPLWNKIYKRNIIEDLSLRNENNISMNEDLIFNQRFFHRVKTLTYIHSTLYHYTLFSTDKCLSKRVCEPHTLLQIAEVIRDSSFQYSSCVKLSRYDKFYYWDFLRMAFLNAFLLSNYTAIDKLKMIDVFLWKIDDDADFEEYLSRLGSIKHWVYKWKSKYVIYLFHALYNMMKNRK